MIVQERFQLDPDGWWLVRTYSDAGFMIRQDATGDLYAEAIDPEDAHRTYTETDIPIEDDASAEEIVDILLGGESE